MVRSWFELQRKTFYDVTFSLNFAQKFPHKNIETQQKSYL